MATDDAPRDLDRLTANLARIEALSARLVGAMGRRQPHDTGLAGPGQDVFLKAGAAYWMELVQNPARIMERQVGYWGKALTHFVETQHRLAQGRLAPPDPGPRDRRFANPLWDTHPWFNYVKQQYLLSARAVEDAVADLGHLEPREQKRVAYFAKQIVDLLSPTNFLGTNPEALSRAVETDGQSLVDGLENLVRDLEANDGDLLVTLADRSAFRVGENLATQPGSVVYRNRLFELIQYAPMTSEVHAVPLVIFPPWINKFYILDLKPANSLIRWLVEQGHTLFVVSWKNPDASYADTGMTDYIEEGYLEAIRTVKAITGAAEVNATGYCIAGTTLALTLALMESRGDASVASATFLTTLTDFSDQGEVGVFLDDDFVDGIERETAERGVLHAFFMARTFSYLRSNDLVYAPAIKSYMLGEAPPAFDLLYWNGDGTNLPARMAMEYLRGLCQEDRFARGGFEAAGARLHIEDVKVPVFSVACETDHIAAWASSLAGVRQFGSADKTFVLSQSGHVAGIVNPPTKRKYGHYTHDGPLAEPAAWRAEAAFREGSWWPRWGEWLARRSGAKVPARAAGSAEFPPLDPAPGSYVRSQTPG